MSEHFTREELQCPHCRAMPYTDEHFAKLEALRAVYGSPIPISSAFRCPQYNDEISGTGTTGPHTQYTEGMIALDVPVYGRLAYRLIWAAMMLGWTGIGPSQKGDHRGRFVHVDCCTNAPNRPRPWIWTY